MEFPKELKNPIQSGNFTFYDTSIEGVKVVDVKLYGDARGGFMETYREENFVAGGIDTSLYRITSPHPFKVCSVVFTSRLSILRQSLCV